MAIKKKKTSTKSTAASSAMAREFVSGEKNGYDYSLGNLVATSFSGFIAGIVVACLIWIVIVNVYYIS